MNKYINNNNNLLFTGMEHTSSYFDLLPSDLIIELFKPLRKSAKIFADTFGYMLLYETFINNLIKGYYPPHETFYYMSNYNFHELSHIDYQKNPDDTYKRMIDLLYVCAKIYVNQDIYITDEIYGCLYLFETKDNQYVALTIMIDENKDKKSIKLKYSSDWNVVWGALSEQFKMSIIRQNF